MPTRRQFIQTSAATAVAATTLSACSKEEQMALPKISHTVFFWLKNPDSVEDRNKLI